MYRKIMEVLNEKGEFDFSRINKEEINMDTEMINNKDLRKVFFRWWWINEISHTNDRMTGLSLFFALIPVLKKIYRDTYLLAEAYQRHIMYFNTQCIWGGGLITGILTFLEEERMKKIREENQEPDIDIKMIKNTKTGLMGPLAGLGDSLDSGRLQYVLISIFSFYSFQGNFLGVIIPFLLFVAITYINGLFLVNLGYREGRGSARNILTNKKIKKMIDRLSIFGVFLLGNIAYRYTNRSDMFHEIYNNAGGLFLLKLITVLIIGSMYLYMEKKGLGTKKIMIFIIVFSILVGLLKRH